MPKTKITIKGDAKKAIDDLKKKIDDNMRVMVGIPHNTTPYPDGTKVPEVAAKNEFGSPEDRIPERSFMRSTINEERENIKKDLTKIAVDVSKGKLNLELGLGMLGKKYSDKVQKKIIDIDTPPNSAYTIAMKGSSNPLVDTGHLNRSINYEIRSAKDA